MKCAVSSPMLSKSRLPSHPHVPQRKPETQCHRLRRLNVSRLANFLVSNPRYGAEHRTYSAIVFVKGCVLSAKPCSSPIMIHLGMAASAIVSCEEYRRSRDPKRNTYRRRMDPAPTLRAYSVSLLGVVSTEQTVTQVPHTSPPRSSGPNASGNNVFNRVTFVSPCPLTKITGQSTANSRIT